MWKQRVIGLLGGAVFLFAACALGPMDEHGDHPVFRWIWTGTNTGPGGTGPFVRITGYEEWTLDSSGLIAYSDGHYDEAEFQRRLQVGAGVGRHTLESE